MKIKFENINFSLSYKFSSLSKMDYLYFSKFNTFFFKGGI